MKTSARFLAMLLAILMVASAALTVTASSFKDVPDNYDHRDAIDVLAKLGVINGYEDGTFKPDAKVERDEMAKLSFVLATTFFDAGTGSANFTDTKGNWAEGYISWCVAESIIGGHGDGTFRPDDNVTYDQALKMVCAVLGYTDFASSKWPTDVRLVGIKQLNLNKGLPSTLNGSDELTRGQVAQIMYNALFVPMNITKTVLITKDDTVDGSTYTVPMQVSQQLALDVWKFKTYTGQIVSTERFAFALPTGKADVIKAEGFKDDETGKPAESKLELDREYELDEIGLSDYEGKTDGLFAREIKLFFLDGELVENTALVYGSFDYDVVLATVKKSDGKADDLTKVSVAGTKYDIYGAKGVYYTMSADGVATKATEEDNSFVATSGYESAYGSFPKDSKEEYISGQKIPDLLLSIYASNAIYAKETSSAAIDKDGDGVYDYVFVIPQMAYQVMKIETVTNTKTNKKETQYTFDALLSTWSRGTDGKPVTNGIQTGIKYWASDITFNGTLSKDDIIVAAKFASLFQVDYKVSGIETYVVRDADGGTRFATDPGTNNYWNIPGNTAFHGALAANRLATSSIGPDLSTGIFYVINKRIIYSTVIENIVPVKFGVLIATEGQTEFIYDSATGKYVRKFPAILTVDGKQMTVNLSKIDGISSLSNDSGNVYGQYMMEYAGGDAVYANKFIAYTIDKDGYYEIYTENVLTPSHSIFNDIDDEEELVIAANQDISYAKSSGFYKIGDTYFDLDGNSTIYYIDTEGVLSVYTKNNIPKEFAAGTKTKTVAYFVNADEYVKTLVAVMITGELEPSATSGANDADRHLLFLGDGDGKEVDGKEIYYIYRYFDINAGELVDTHSVLPATTSSSYKGATGIPMYNGEIGAYKNDGQTLEKVNLATNNYISKTRVTGYFKSTKSIFTSADSDGISLSKAKFIELEIADSEVDPTKKEIKDATLTSYDDLVAAYEDAKDENIDFYVIYGFKTDTSGKEVVYIIYGAKLDDQYEHFNDVFNTLP